MVQTEKKWQGKSTSHYEHGSNGHKTQNLKNQCCVHVWNGDFSFGQTLAITLSVCCYIYILALELCFYLNFKFLLVLYLQKRYTKGLCVYIRFYVYTSSNSKII